MPAQIASRLFLKILCTLTAIQPVFDLAMSYMVVSLARALLKPKQLLQAFIDQNASFFNS